MRVIATTFAPDIVPSVHQDGTMIGPEAFAIQAVWLPRDYPGLPSSWEMYSQMLPYTVAEILGGEYTTHQLSSETLNPSSIIPSENQLLAAIHAHCKEARGWVNVADEPAMRALRVYQEFGQNFAGEFILNPNIVVQESPPSLNSLVQVVTKSKELAVPLAGMYIGMQAAAVAHVSDPVIYLLCVSGGILLCGPSLAFAREIDL
jgi:hypothetical protein